MFPFAIVNPLFVLCVGTVLQFDLNDRDSNSWIRDSEGDENKKEEKWLG